MTASGCLRLRMEEGDGGAAAVEPWAPISLVRVPVTEGAGSRAHQDASHAAAAASELTKKLAAWCVEVSKPNTIDYTIAGFGLASSLVMLGVGLGEKVRLRDSMSSDQKLCHKSP